MLAREKIFHFLISIWIKLLRIVRRDRGLFDDLFALVVQHIEFCRETI